MSANGHGRPLGDDESVLELEVMAARCCECAKCH